MMFMALLNEAQFPCAKRLVEKKFRWPWVLSMLFLVYAAISVILSVVWRFRDNPTYMSLVDSTLINVSFPSVHVCPELYYPPHRVDAFIDNITLPPGGNKTYIRSVIYQLAAYYSPDINYTMEDLKELEKLLDYNNMDVETAATMLTPSCEESIIRCRFFRRVEDCSKFFRMMITSYGFCCVFNGRSLRDDLLKYGDQEHDSENRSYTDEVGVQSGIMFIVNQSQELLDVDVNYKWLVVQGGGYFIDSSSNGTALSPRTEHWAAYSEKSSRIADSALDLSSDLRGCRMSYERLEYFPEYHKQYCLVECELQRTLRLCKCAAFVHPKPLKEKICTANSFLCIKLTRGIHNCNCPATCDIDADSVQFQYYDLENGVPTYDTIYEDVDIRKVSVVRVFIKTHRCRISIRRSFFGTSQLFSQLGGVVSVFLGCSTLTIVELVQLLYHFVLERIKSMSEKKQAKQVPDKAKKQRKKKQSKKVKFTLSNRNKEIEK